MIWLRWLWSVLAGQRFVSLLVGGLSAVLVLYPLYYLIQAALNVGDPQARPPQEYGLANFGWVSEYPVILWNTVVVAVLAIIGRSGVGKSVTLGHIMGFLKPDSGSVIVAHEDITGYPESELRRIRRKVTMVFQSGALFDSLTVGENILFSLELREDYDESNKEDVVDGLLSMVGLLDYKEAFPSDLSTGHRRAVAIARALVNQPALLLADEPTGNLDSQTSIEIMGVFQKLNHEGITIVMVTHELDIARYTKRNVIMRDGVIVDDHLVSNRSNATTQL